MHSDDDYYTIDRLHELQVNWSHFIRKLKFPIWGTLIFNEKIWIAANKLEMPSQTKRISVPKIILPEMARGRLTEFHARIDKKLLGRKFYKKPTRDRTLLLAVPERLSGNYHYHVFVRPPPGLQNMIDFINLAPKIWKNLCKNGDVEFEYLREDVNLIKTSRYSSKELWRLDNQDNVVILPERFVI